MKRATKKTFGLAFCVACLFCASVAAQTPPKTTKPNQDKDFIRLPPLVIKPLPKIASLFSLPRGSGPCEIRPNDPGYFDQYGALFSLPQALCVVVNQLDKNGQDAVVVVLDEGVDCDNQPDLRKNCLAQYNKDFSGDGWHVGFHGTAAGSIVGAEINNGIGIPGASLSSHVKIVSVNIVSANGYITYSGVVGGLQYAYDLRNKFGLNVVAVSCSFGGAPLRDQSIADKLRLLKQSGIYVFVAATEQFDGSTGKNLDGGPFISMTSYSLEANSSVIAVTAWDGITSQQLQWASNWGPLTVALAAPGVAVPVIFENTIGGFDGTSAAAPGAAALYALIRATVEPDPDRAADRLKASAVMETSLQGKVGYGRIDAYRALTMTFDQSTSGLALLNQQGSPRAVALDSVTMLQGDFPRTDLYNFSQDTKPRLMLFSPAQLSVSGLVMTGVDLYGKSYNFPIENVSPLTLSDQRTLSELVVRTPDSAPAGDYWLHFTYQGTDSNKVLITLKP